MRIYFFLICTYKYLLKEKVNPILLVRLGSVLMLKVIELSVMIKKNMN